nr:MAG TPA: capsid stabilizing protein [Caudoviricetes sp.]
MLRDIIAHEQKAVPAYYKAAAALKTGMGVVVDVTDGTVELPSAETADNIYLVDKERVPVGEMAARTQFSDYEAAFNTVASGEIVKLRHYDAGEEFATDAFTGSIAKGDYVTVGADGKWKKATGSTSAVASRYICVDPAHDDAGHTLLRVLVQDTAGKNS